jgi:hypothetical protein
MMAAMDLLETILEFARAGFDRVNAVQGLIIALVAALLSPSWRRLPVFVVGATTVHVAADALLPVISGGASLRLPQVLELSFWSYVATLLVGYLIIIAILFLIKRLVLRR